MNPLQTYQETVNNALLSFSNSGELSVEKRLKGHGDYLQVWSFGFDQATEALATAAELYANQRVVKVLQDLQVLSLSGKSAFELGTCIDSLIASYKGGENNE